MESEVTESAERLATITVEAGKYTRIDTPVSIALEGIEAAELSLKEFRGGRFAPVLKQIEPGEPRRLWWILSDTTKAGEKKTYELTAGRSFAERVPHVAMRTGESSLEVQITGKSVLRYNYDIVMPPEGAGELYARSGFIHPLWSPGGEVLTWMHPEDHVHHLGLWNPWTRTKFEGRDVDFWNIGKGEGTVRFVRFDSVRSGPVFGEFCAIQEHVDLNAPGGEKAALNEELTVRVWNSGPQSDYWIVDYTTEQRCSSSSPLQLIKYRYGGLGFRATEKWGKDNRNYLTSEGRTRKDGHATRGRWCNLFGSTEKGPAGILFMSHPANREHPEPMRIWPEGHVFFNFCPIQKADWTLEPGNEYVLRYRLYVYDGSVTIEKAERLWRDFAEPPTVTLEKSK
jgi:hypothetical protein